MGIFKLIRAFRKVNGRSPTPSELAKLKQQAEEMSTQENVIPFPGGGKDRRSVLLMILKHPKMLMNNHKN
jgi:hypothetical protein